MSPARRKRSTTGRAPARPVRGKRAAAGRAPARPIRGTRTPRAKSSATTPTSIRSPRATPAARTGIMRRPPPTAGLAIACARAADEHLGQDTLVVDLRGTSPIADWAVLTTASSSPHARAVSQAVADAIHDAGARLHHREGDAESSWILLDASNVIVHIMDAVTRRSYDLERLWASAPRIDWRKASPPRSRG